MPPERTALYTRYMSYRLEWVAQVARQEADAIYQRECGLDIRQLRVLRVAAEKRGLTVSEIVERTMFERTLVSRLIGELVRRKLVVRRISETDARQVHVDITEVGETKVAFADALGDELNEDLLAMLTVEEQKIFERCLEKLMRWQPPRASAVAGTGAPAPRKAGRAADGRQSRTGDGRSA